MIRSIIYKGGKKKMAWISKTAELSSYEYYTGSPPTPTPPTPGKRVQKEIIAILSSKRGLHKLYKY